MKYIINQNEIEIRDTENSQAFDWLRSYGILIPVKERAWPQAGDTYYMLNDGNILKLTFFPNEVHLFREKVGIFRTLEEAQAKLDEINARSV